MKKLNIIFVFIFLFGMLFTLFQNVSLLEEEVKNKIELSKKTKEAKEGADGDEDPDPDVENDYLTGSHGADLASNYSLSSDNLHIKSHYYYLHISELTRPPKTSA